MYHRLLAISPRTALVAALTLISFSGPCPRTLDAQMPRRSYPNSAYYDAFIFYYKGEYLNASHLFRRAARGGVATSRGRWIDSICYYTMIGECFYHMGRFGDALEQYNAALQLVVAHEGWTARIRWPEKLEPSQRTIPRPPTWGRSARNRPLARIPRVMQMVQGDTDTLTSLQTGGLLQNRYYMTVDATEVLRCTALAMRRRHQILGPLCRHDRLTDRLADSVARMQVPPNHWLATWRRALVGVALSAQGKTKEAVRELSQSLSIGNTLDHPMTSLAMLELGDIAFREDRLGEAATWFYEATFPAAKLSLYDDVGEGLHAGAVLHTMAGKNGLYAPLAPAARWSHREAEPLEVLLLADAADQSLIGGDVPGAEQLIDQARRVIGRSDMKQGPSAVRLDFLATHALIRRGKAAVARQALAKVIVRQQAVSPWLFQLATADRLVTRRAVSSRIAAALYRGVLREPSVRDWQIDPLDALAYLAFPKETVLEHWFELSLARKEHDQAVMVLQRIRRGRWERQLPLGGRLLNLRWLITAPPERLPDAIEPMRRDLFLAQPSLAASVKLSNELIERLRRVEPVAGDAQPAALAERNQILQRLGVLVEQQEQALWDLALRRVPSPQIFPPMATLEQLQEAIDPDEVVVTFLQTRKSTYIVVLRKETYTVESIGASRAWHTAVAQWLRAARVHDGNKSLPFDATTLDAWKKASMPITAQIERVVPGGVFGKAKKVIIVPDGVLWYLPFESLTLSDNQMLMERATVRYLPLLGLIALPGSPPRTQAKTVLVEKRFWEDADDAAANDGGESPPWLTDFADAVPDLHPLRRWEVPTSLRIPAWDRLIVLADLSPARDGLTAWSPLVVDRGRPGSSLYDWIIAPWGAPHDVVLSGFRTAAEGGLRRGASGEELFLISCGLLASGCESIIMSRWRIPSTTAADLAREYVQELGNLSPSHAWQRSVELLWRTDIDPASSPRLRVDKDIENLPAKHPFFWSSQMLIDISGKLPK